MKKFLFVLMLGVSSLSFGQSDTDTVKYSMLSDNPNYTYWGAGLSYGLSLDAFNFPLVGFGVDGIFMHEKFAFNLHSNYNLLERLTDYSLSGFPDHESIYEPEKSREFELRGSYFFNSNTETVDQRVKLKQKGNTIYVMDIPAKLSTRYGIDIGFGSGVTYYNFGNATLDGIDNSGNTVSLESNTDNEAISSMFNQHQIRIGVNRTKSTNFELVTKQYGKKSVKDFTRIYAHVVIGMSQKLDDIYYLGQDLFGNEFYTQYDITTNGEFLPVGAALGYEYYTMGKLGVSWIGELGLMPGPKYRITTNTYLKLKLRFHFGQFI